MKKILVFAVIIGFFVAFGAKIENRNKRSPFFGQQGCETVMSCIISFNKIFAYRINFNPVTAYDRLRSHYEGWNGWTPSQRIRMQLFQMRKDHTDRRLLVETKMQQEKAKKIRDQIRRVKMAKEMFILTNMTYDENENTKIDDFSFRLTDHDLKNYSYN